MLQIKRFVALTCALLLVPSGCMAGGYDAAASPRYGKSEAPNIPLSPVSGATVDYRVRNFESIESVAAGAVESDMWSAGDTDTLAAGSFTPNGGSIATAAAAAPPPPSPASPAPGFSSTPAPEKEAPKDMRPEPAAAPASASGSATGKKVDAEGVAVIRAPMLVYTGRMQMAVYEVKNSLSEVETLAKVLGGFLAKRDDRSITIRVPASRFDEAMRRIEKLGDMLNRDVQVEDVTEEFNDVEIRLKNARAVRDRLEQLLAKASKVEESIQIERELERVALTIERLEGRMKFLKDRATFSTITVVFQPRSSAELSKRNFNLPVPWLYELGLGRLLNL